MPQIIMDYQEQFPGRDIYVSGKTYIDLLNRLELGFDLTYDSIIIIRTMTRIYMSYRVPNYVAYAIEGKGVTDVL